MTRTTIAEFLTSTLPPAGDLPPIALTGKMGAGKSTVADLMAPYGYVRLPLARPLREAAIRLYGPEAENDREILQKLGNAIRTIDEDTLVNALLRKINDDGALYQSVYRGRVVVDDCRFPNELWKLKSAGFMIGRVTADEALRIDRLQKNGKLTDPAQLQDATETALDDFEAVDFTIENNDNERDQLGSRVGELVRGLVPA